MIKSGARLCAESLTKTLAGIEMFSWTGWSAFCSRENCFLRTSLSTILAVKTCTAAEQNQNSERAHVSLLCTLLRLIEFTRPCASGASVSRMNVGSFCRTPDVCWRVIGDLCLVGRDLVADT